MISRSTKNTATGLTQAEALKLLERWRQAADAVRPQGAPVAMKELINDLATLSRSPRKTDVFADVVSDAAGEANMTLLRVAGGLADEPPGLRVAGGLADEPPGRILSSRGTDDSAVLEYGGTDRWVRFEWTDRAKGLVDVEIRFDFWIPDEYEEEGRRLTGAEAAARCEPKILRILNEETA